ncbi:MAG TPA: hypothetical protein VKX46_20530 [Ktedonobacteraceae bacterium]|nr:hypothetical protein [Ktedonobacteraceae bacterium]
MRFTVILCSALLVLSVTSFHVFAAPAHGCMPTTPPAVTGTPVPPPVMAGVLFINEVLTFAGTRWDCPNADVPPSLWVELYNPQDQPLDLYSLHSNLDSGPDSNKYYVPFGAAVPAHGYLVLFPPGNTFGAALLNGSFTLRFMIGNTPMDQVVVPQLAMDTSYARLPDGSATWQITATPTIGASNTSLLPTATPTDTTTRRHSDTPTATTTRKPTPTPTSKPSGSAGSTHTTYSTTPTAPGPDQTSSTADVTDANSTPAATQVAWNTLQMPDATPSPPASTNTTTLSTSSGSPADTPTSPPPPLNRILLSVGALALALGLFWSWRRFFATRDTSTHS